MTSRPAPEISGLAQDRLADAFVGPSKPVEFRVDLVSCKMGEQGGG